MESANYERQLDAAKQFIEQNDRFLVVSHVNPDGDAIGSTCAVGRLLERLNKSFVMMNEDPVPKKFVDLLWGTERIRRPSEGDIPENERYDCVIAVDCADFRRIGRSSSHFADDVRLLNIDHHPTNDRYGTVSLVQPQAAATCEVLYDLFERFDLSWDEPLATCVYTGILTDTGGFRYSNTSPKIMHVASELLGFGVDAHIMAEQLLERRTMQHIQLLKRALATLSFTDDHKVSWVAVRAKDIEETAASNDDLAGIVNYPRNIEGVEVGILFKEIAKQEIKVSMRSNGDIDVSAIAQSFNGGGHFRAAGATLEMPLDEAIALVIDKVSRAIV